MNHMTQLAKLIDKPAEYNFPIETIPMKGICDDKLIIPEYIIDIKNKSKKTLELVEYYEKLKNIDQLKKSGNIIEFNDKKKFKKKLFKRKKFFKKTK